MKTEPRPTRAIFREDAARATLALDPGGSGVLAALRRGVQPQPGAFGYFDCPPPAVFLPEEVVDGVAVLAISGPLEHHQHWLWTSYEALVTQIDRALACGDVRALVLKIDSPGGVAAGMGECHKAIRRMAKAYSKPVYAYADEMACSAAYHLASACSEVWTSESGVLGSVGVILCTIDESKALEKAGVAVRYVVTGARKADMHPGQPVTDDVLDVAQAKVDYLGALFFAAVGKARGVAPAKIEALQAAVFHGPDAVTAGLCDGVAGWSAFFRYVKDSVRATLPTDRATAPGARGTSPSKATTMKLLQAQAALAKARSDFKAATAALDASPGDKALRKAWATALTAKDAAKAEVNAKMSKTTKTSRHTVTEETDSEAESVPPPSTEKSSGAESSAMSEEEEESAEAESDKARGESEEEEEEAIAKAWHAAEKAYAKAAAGFDPYGVKHGPKGLRKAAAKAAGLSSKSGVSAILGSLSALPQRRAADAKVIARVETLEANGRKAKVAAIVEKAKAEGRAGATSHDGRVSLRALGMSQGASFLRAHVETLPVVASTKERTPRDDGDGNALGAPGTDAQAKMMEQAMAGLSAKERAEFAAIYDEKTKAAKHANGAGRI